MLIKKAKYKKVLVWKQEIISDEVHGCDYCKAEIKDYPNELGRLEVAVYKLGGSTNHYHLCSWECVFKFVLTIKTDYFFTLPYISYGKDGKGGRSAKEFMKIIKRMKLTI